MAYIHIFSRSGIFLGAHYLTSRIRIILRLPASFTKTEVDNQKEEGTPFQETEKSKDQGRRLRKEKSKELENKEQEATDAPTLLLSPQTRPYAWSISYTSFPLRSIRSYRYIETLGVSLKSPKESPHNTSAVVCANGRLERCLRGIDGWIGGTGPKILEWLRKNGYD
ncbi:hypothetical protein F5876DRAFT_83301 [Lentinula aff. lateritia]|uniref:Uncharacterized protein n=1 Tax=Lentinula aff. lateritia TaxID=2804960 RepID=A0ACC1TI42_9AGAR|nr:hypothetical protein F5876DRAFT_83301 [Lentinula aff. lateritia]